jgi:hypothetical protein
MAYLKEQESLSFACLWSEGEEIINVVFCGSHDQIVLPYEKLDVVRSDTWLRLASRVACAL